MAGKNGNWMKKASTRMKKKGTVGTFTAYWKRQGYSGVTAACIAKGLKSSNVTTRKRAGFAKASRTVAKRKKR